MGAIDWVGGYEWCGRYIEGGDGNMDGGGGYDTFLKWEVVGTKGVCLRGLIYPLPTMSIANKYGDKRYFESIWDRKEYSKEAERQRLVKDVSISKIGYPSLQMRVIRYFKVYRPNKYKTNLKLSMGYHNDVFVFFLNLNISIW